MPDNEKQLFSGSSESPDASRPENDRAKFKKNLIRVLAVQVVTLLLLGYLQYIFTP
ncbi:MAG TPA: hypothetical protein VGM82_16785 [Gemmatimonadaceae bacterium]